MNFKIVIGIVGGFLSYIMGGWDIMIQILVTLTIVDYITGILAGAYLGELSSKAGYKGIIKKFLMFSVIMVANFIDIIISSELIRNVTVMFYISNECLSIVENAIRSDVKIPKKIKDILNNFLEKSDRSETK